MPPEPQTWDLLVNATPVGTAPADGESLLERDALRSRNSHRAVVYDLVYNPPTTRLLREAEAAGCVTIGGLDMLVAQARRQFTWWTGKTVEGRVFKDAAITRLHEAEGARG
jgi:shikimate 5-dehydrogenase